MGKSKRRGGSVEYWITAITKASEVGRETAYMMKSLWKRLLGDVYDRLEDLLPLGGVHMLDLGKGTLAAKTYSKAERLSYYGIDSSRTKPVRVGLKYVAFISGTSVKIPGPSPSRAETIYMDVKPKPVPESGDLSSYKLEVELEMFDLEAQALATTVQDIERNGIEKESVVALDGPLVDPPSLISRAIKSGLAPKAESLARKRAYLAGLLYRTGASLVGFVKRLRGDIFLESYFGGEAERYSGQVGDRVLAFAIASAAVARAREYGLCRPERPVLIVTKPVKLPVDKAPDVQVYNEEIEGLVGGEAGVYTSLYVPGYCLGNRKVAARIEFVSRPGFEEAEAVRIAAMLEASLVPGLYWPLPVLLAHKACTIRRREGTKLLREVMSKHAVEVLHGGVPSLLEFYSD